MKRQVLLMGHRFRKDEAGSASIESLFWIPMFVFFLVLVMDTSFIFFGKAQALRFIQDGNRALSVGALADEDAAELYIKTAISDYAPTAEVHTEIMDGMIISTTVKMPATELMIVGSMPVFQNTIISVTADHFQEQ